MAAEEMKKEVAGQPVELQEKQQTQQEAASLQESLDGLNKFGGFQLLKGLIKGVEKK